MSFSSVPIQCPRLRLFFLWISRVLGLTSQGFPPLGPNPPPYERTSKFAVGPVQSVEFFRFFPCHTLRNILVREPLVPPISNTENKPRAPLYFSLHSSGVGVGSFLLTHLFVVGSLITLECLACHLPCSMVYKVCPIGNLFALLLKSANMCPRRPFEFFTDTWAILPFLITPTPKSAFFLTCACRDPPPPFPFVILFFYLPFFFILSS